MNAETLPLPRGEGGDLFRAGISVTAGLLLYSLLETPPVFG